MHNLIKSCIDAVKPPTDLINDIINHSRRDASEAIASAFKEGHIVGRPGIPLHIDLLSLYSKHPTARGIIENIQAVESELIRVFTDVYGMLLERLGFNGMNEIVVADLFAVDIKIGTFPFAVPQLAKKEHISFKSTHLAEHTECVHRLTFAQGRLVLANSWVSERSTVRRCMAKSCLGRTHLLFFNSRCYVVDENTRKITRTSAGEDGSSSRCKSCMSRLVLIGETTRLAYRYAVSMEGTYIHAVLTAGATSDSGAIVGSLARNERGHVYMRGLGFFATHRAEPALHIRPNGRVPEKCMLDITRFFLFYKKEVVLSDSILLVILNILNCHAEEAVLESPVSGEPQADGANNRRMPEATSYDGMGCDSSLDFEDACSLDSEYDVSDGRIGAGRARNRSNSSSTGLNKRDDTLINYASKEEQETNEHSRFIENDQKINKMQTKSINAGSNDPIKILIYTNDAEYVKHIAKNMVSMRICYSLNALKVSDSCVCIRDAHDRDSPKLRGEADHVFAVNVEGEPILTYRENAPYRIKKRRVIMSESLTRGLQEAYVDARRIFKGVIEPFRLFQTLKALVLSMQSIMDDGFDDALVINAIKKHFMDKILPVEK